MILSLGEVVLLLVLVGGGIFLFRAMRVREIALQSASGACKREDVQLLDQTVSISRMSLSRDERGHWRVWRQYRFEYSADGVTRQRGHVIMLGHRMEGLILADTPRETIH
jgi:hypothetical protein